MPETKSNSRRWLQFSLRSLLLAFLLVAVFFGGRESGQRLLKAERERAEAELRKSEFAKAQAERASRQARMAHLQLKLSQAELDLRKARARFRTAIEQQRLELLEREQQRLQWERLMLKPQAMPRRVPSPLPIDWDRQPSRSLPINEYWHRKEHPRRIRDA
jgi:hypothetical protein